METETQPTEKPCRRCGEVKPLDAFYREATGPLGRNRWCKVCQDTNRKRTDVLRHARDPEAWAQQRQRQTLRWREKMGPEALRKKANDFNDKVRRETFAAYGGPCCACCGESDIRFLALDHINGGGTKERREGVSRGGVGHYRRLRAQGFPPGYQVLCFNCNWGRYRNGGVCPHQEP